MYFAMRKVFPLMSLWAMVLTQPVLSQGADLLVRTDVECRLTVDGSAQETLIPNKPLHLTLAPGEHRIEAVPVSGGNKWQRTITVAPAAGQEELNIELRANSGYWIDPDTKLMWTVADNGFGLSWGQAVRYCRELTLAGLRNWTLPSIEDLQAIFDRTHDQSGYHVKGPIKLSGWQWSATPGAQQGEGWALDFGDGGRASVAAGDSGLNRALCVRPMGK
jgi:Protein of unknown function (DUF1566)